jgi:hypothetical protein
MINIIQPLISEFLPFAKKRMGFKKPPKIFLKRDNQNAKDPLGKTAYYDPENRSVTLYVTNRHPKDVMRSLSHELVHHTQNCNGEFDKVHSVGDGYAQNDEHLREMERQAYEMGNLCFRDWEDGIKNTTYYESLNKGAQINMSTKDWKNKEISTLLSEAWGFKFNTLQEFDEFNGTGEVQEEAEEVEGEELDELAQAGPAPERRKPHKRAGTVPEKEEKEEKEEELEERRGRGRDREGMAPDNRRRPMEEVADDSDGEEVVEESDEDDTQEESVKSKTTISEAKIREILEKAIKLAKARKTTKE